MAVSRQRAQSHSTQSGRDRYQELKTDSAPEEADSCGVPLQQIIKVSRKSQPKSRQKAFTSESEFASDPPELDTCLDVEGIVDDDLASPSPKDKFKLFSPRKKQSPRSVGTTGSSPRSQSRNSSPRSTHSSPRSSTPVRLSLSQSGGPSPRIGDVFDGEVIGELPINRREAVSLLESAKYKFSELDHAEAKQCGILFRYSHRREVTREYDVIVTGTDGFGLGSFFCLLDRSQKLGEGGYSEVFVAYNLQTGVKCAAKVFKSKADYSIIVNEKNCLVKMQRFLGTLGITNYKSDLERIIFMTFFPGVSLLKVLYRYVPEKMGDEGLIEAQYLEKIQFPVSVRLEMVRKVMEAVVHIHDVGYIHRDIKSDNFLCDFSKPTALSVNLIDLDTAISCEIKTTRIASTFGYLAPELSKDVPDVYSVASDLFSVGIVMWEILSDVNFQQGLTDKYNDIMHNERWSRHLSRKELVTLLLESQEVDIDLHAAPDPLNSMIEKFVYQSFLKDHVVILLTMLTEENPGNRLKSSSLREELQRFNSLLDKFHRTVKCLTALVGVINEVQQLEVPLKSLIFFATDPVSLNEKNLHEITGAVLMDKTYDAPSATGKPEKPVIEQLTRYVALLSGLKTFIITMNEVRELEIPVPVISDFLMKFTYKPAETLAFFNALSPPNQLPDISSSRR